MPSGRHLAEFSDARMLARPAIGGGTRLSIRPATAGTVLIELGRDGSASSAEVLGRARSFAAPEGTHRS